MKILKNIEGSALAFVLVAMTVAFVLVGGIITVSMSDNDQVMYQADYMNAYYVARAGAESMAMEMMRMDNEDYKYFDIKQTATATNMLDGKGDATITVVNDSDHYIIQSVGTYNSVEANVSIRMIYADKTDFKYAAYSIESMGSEAKLIGIGPVVGTLASGGKVHINRKNNDIGPKTQVIDNVIVDLGITFPDIQVNSIFTNTNTIPIPDIPITLSNSTLIKGTNVPKNNKDAKKEKDIDKKVLITVNTDSAEYKKDPTKPYDKTFTISEASTGEKWLIVYFEDDTVIDGIIKIKGSNNCMIIVEKSLYLGGGLIIEGNGIVELYVIDDSTTEEYDDYDLVLQGNNVYGIGPMKFSDSTPENTSPTQLLMYIYGDKDLNIKNGVDIGNNVTIYGYIFGPEAEIDLKNGSTNIYGGLYAKDIDLEAEVSIINPNSLNTTNTLYKAMQIDYWE